MRHLLSLVSACAASVLLYAAAFAMVLDRPLDLGFLSGEIEARLARGAALPSPKLVILAGSNGPYSHRCEVIEPMLLLPCVNGGIAVGIGLDYLFLRWERLLRAGDVVYLPMELAQYTRSRPATNLGPDAAIMFRHDRATLAQLPPDRWLGALFAYDLRAGVLSVIEGALNFLPVQARRAAAEGASNAWGDHVGHAAAPAGEPDGWPDAAAVPTASAIADGYGARLIAGFARWCFAHRVRVVGGLPTRPSGAALPAATLAAIRDVYERPGGQFLLLANHSRYQAADFFDSPDHLIEPCQIRHSELVARALGVLLRRDVEPAPAQPSSAACLD